MDTHHRRHSPRQVKEAPIQVLLTLGNGWDLKENFEQVPATLVNESEGGLYIEIDRFLMHGVNVSLVMVSPEEYQPGEAYDIYDGLVLRCEKVNQASSRFGVGIKTLRKVVCAPIQSSRFNQRPPAELGV